MAVFRANCRGFLLTWASCTEEATLWELSAFIEETIQPDNWVVCKEAHQDGTPHFHAYIEWNKRIDKRIGNQWNYDGKHPNILPKKTLNERQNAFSYCTKDGDFDASTAWQLGYDNETLVDIPNLRDGLDQSDSMLSFLQWGLDNAIPCGFITAAWNCAKTGANTIEEDHVIEGTIKNDRLNFMTFDTTTKKSLVIEGPTRCGKTTWAKKNAPKPALFISHPDELKGFRANYHKSIIFDDMHFNGDRATGKGKWPDRSQVHILDFENPRAINVKHSHAHIPAGVYKIFTCNYFPFEDLPEIKERLVHVNLFE